MVTIMTQCLDQILMAIQDIKSIGGARGPGVRLVT